MDVAGRHVEAGRTAAEVEVMGDGGAEPDQAAGGAGEPITEEDGREDEHVWYVLPAVVRVVVDVEVAGLQGVRRVELGAGAERRPDGTELHRDELRLAHHVAGDVEQRGGAVVRLAHDRRVRRTHELDSHFLRGRDEGLGNDCLVDLIERHGWLPPGCESNVSRGSRAFGWCSPKAAAGRFHQRRLAALAGTEDSGDSVAPEMLRYPIREFCSPHVGDP